MFLPASIALIPIAADSIGPMVPPDLLSFLIWKTCNLEPLFSRHSLQESRRVAIYNSQLVHAKHPSSITTQNSPVVILALPSAATATPTFNQRLVPRQVNILIIRIDRLRIIRGHQETIRTSLSHQIHTTLAVRQRLPQFSRPSAAGNSLSHPVSSSCQSPHHRTAPPSSPPHCPLSPTASVPP